MQAVVLTMASTQRWNSLTKALYALTDQQEASVLEVIQQQQLSTGIVIVVEGYASIQKVGPHQELLSEVITTQSSGNHLNSEPLHRQVIYFDGRGILELRVVYTTYPLKRIVYDIYSNGNIQEAHV